MHFGVFGIGRVGAYGMDDTKEIQHDLTNSETPLLTEIDYHRTFFPLQSADAPCA